MVVSDPPWRPARWLKGYNRVCDKGCDYMRTGASRPGRSRGRLTLSWRSAMTRLLLHRSHQHLLTAREPHTGSPHASRARGIMLKEGMWACRMKHGGMDESLIGWITQNSAILSFLR